MNAASILLADDESAIRTTLRAALETDGYTVSEASNGADALHSMQSQTPDLMVLDLNMPGIDGLGVLQQMKSLVVTTLPKVIVLTAYGSLKTAVKATRLGASDFLEKPITPIELRSTVRSVLDEPMVDADPAKPLDCPARYDAVLNRIRQSLRLAEYENVQTLLEIAAEQNRTAASQYHNLLGVLYEAQQKWRLARKCYTRAIAADANFEPPRINLRRVLELQKLGRSAQEVQLGDEIEGMWFARLPERMAAV